MPWAIVCGTVATKVAAVFYKKTMKKLLFLIWIIPLNGICQQIQWASKMLKCSSDLGGKQYGAKRVLGKPDAFPEAGDSPNAWAPKNAKDGHDFIEIAYDNPQSVKQIAIFENLNSGCLVKIMVGNGDGKYKEVFRNKMQINDWKSYKTEFTRQYYFSKKRRKVIEAPLVNINPGIEYAILDIPENNVKALRIVFNFNKSLGEKQIDAIGISDSDDPLLPAINYHKEFELLKEPEVVFLSANNFSVNTIYKNQIFLSIYDDKEKLYTLDNTNGKWGNIKPAYDGLNANPDYNYLGGIIKSNQKYIQGGSGYDRGTTQTGYKLFKQNGNEVSFDKNLEITSYSNFGETSSMTINNDASVLIMGIESDMSQGGLDLYYTKLKDDGNYQYLQNLGKNINSANDENAPFLLADEEILLFSSNGFSGYGDYDLYYSIKQDNSWNKWTDPINLGPKINSINAETSCYYNALTEELYYTSYKDNKYYLYKTLIKRNLLKN